MHIFALLATQQGRTHTVGEYEIHEKKRDVLEDGTRKIDECDIEKLNNSALL